MTLTELLGSGVGPVSVRTSTQGVTAVFDGHDVECVTEGDTVRLRLEARLLWVGQARAGELRARLSDHALSRPELLMTEVADDGSTVTITLWIDAEPMTPVTLAQAVRTVRRSLAEAEPQLTALGAAIVRDRPASFPSRATAGTAETSTATAEPTTAEAAQGDTSSFATQAVPAAAVQDTPATPVADQPFTAQEATPAQAEPQPVLAEAAAPVVQQEAQAEVDPQAEVEPQAADEPRWGYVQQATEVRGLQDTDQVVGTLVPGQWYELRTSANGWTHVVSVDGAMEGWAAAALLNERRG